MDKTGKSVSQLLATTHDRWGCGWDSGSGGGPVHRLPSLDVSSRHWCEWPCIIWVTTRIHFTGEPHHPQWGYSRSDPAPWSSSCCCTRKTHFFTTTYRLQSHSFGSQSKRKNCSLRSCKSQVAETMASRLNRRNKLFRGILIYFHRRMLLGAICWPPVASFFCRLPRK